MTKKLSKIQQMAASVRTALANIKPKADLSDIDETAVEAAQMREKLRLLEDAEQSEQARLEQQANHEAAKARQAALNKVVESASEMTAKHQQLTEQAETMIGQLVGVLAERERVFDEREVGLYDPAISNEERQVLRDALHGGRFSIGPGQFFNSWCGAVYEACTPTEVGLADRLRGLATPRNHPAQDDPLRGASERLVTTAHGMALTDRVTPEPTPEPQPEKLSHFKQTVDLRPDPNPQRIYIDEDTRRQYQQEEA